MAGIALSGLASGVDTSSIVAQLMAIERQKTTTIANKQTRAQAEQDVLKSIASKLSALKSAAEDLKRTGSAWTQNQTVTSSDASKVGVAKLSGAGVGGHTVQVDRLAASAQRGYDVDRTAAGSLTVGSTAVSYAAGATLTSIADQFNATASSPVYAAVVTNADGAERLVLSARTTGESSRFNLTATAATEDLAYASPAPTPENPRPLNALFRLDGASTPLDSPSNTVENAIPGLRLTLKGVGASPVSVIVGAPDVDRDAIKTKVQALVNAYNAVVDTTRTAINEKSVASPSTTTDLKKGTLFGDSGLSSMLSRLRQDLPDTIAGLTGIDDLGDIGIGVPAATGGASTDDAKAGRFTLDATKLTAALDEDWNKVASFLDGFAGKVSAAVKQQTGSTDSLLDGRVATKDRSLEDLADQLTAMNTRLDAEEARYKAQFAAMESAMANYQTQQSWLTGQLSALGNGA
jgi:flagellar hook-associated protein 2